LCVLICSRQISRPLSHLSSKQWQVTSGKWSGYFLTTCHSLLAPVIRGRYHTRIVSCFNANHDQFAAMFFVFIVPLQICINPSRSMARTL